MSKYAALEVIVTLVDGTSRSAIAKWDYETFDGVATYILRLEGGPDDVLGVHLPVLPARSQVVVRWA
jgi:hypothetical protein